MLPPPPDVVDLVERWKANGQPPQPPIPWPRQRWLDTFGNHRAVIESLPEVIARDDVRTVAASATRNPSSALDAFIAAMAWGYGSVGYGPWRTERVLRQNSDAARRLHQAATIVARDGAVAGYRFLANEGRLKHLGPAFGTKFLHFIRQAPGAAPGLIHDAVVTRSLSRHGGPKLSAAAWNTAVYTQFVATITRWAAELKVQPEELETQLFRADVAGQWAK